MYFYLLIYWFFGNFVSHCHQECVYVFKFLLSSISLLYLLAEIRTLQAWQSPSNYWARSISDGQGCNVRCRIIIGKPLLYLSRRVACVHRLSICKNKLMHVYIYFTGYKTAATCTLSATLMIARNSWSKINFEITFHVLHIYLYMK